MSNSLGPDRGPMFFLGGKPPDQQTTQGGKELNSIFD